MELKKISISTILAWASGENDHVMKSFLVEYSQPDHVLKPCLDPRGMGKKKNKRK